MESQIKSSNQNTRPEVRDPSQLLMGETSIQQDQSDITSFVTTMQPTHEDVACVVEAYDELNKVDSISHSISTVLSRPQTMNSVTWPSASPRGTILNMFTTDALITSLNKTKILGFGLIKYSSVVRLQINLPPLAQGILRLSYLPGGYWSYSTDLYNQMSSITPCDATACWLSSLTHVEINVNTEQEATLKVPFVFNYPFIRCDAPYDKYYGTFILWVYSPLLGVSSCDIVPWTHMEDVVVSAPSTQNVPAGVLSNDFQLRTQQMKDGNLTIIDDDEDNRSESEKPDHTVMTSPAPNHSSYNSSSHFSNVLGVAELKKGFISGISRVTSNVLFGLSAVFPTISYITLPAAGIASGVSRIAKIFGFGRKLNSFQTKPIVTRNLEGFSNTDSLDDGQVIGIYHDSDLYPKDLFGCPIDEMNLNYIASHPGYIGAFTIKTTTKANSLVYALPLGPLRWFQIPQTTVGTSTYNIYPPIAYSMLPFKYWRGSRYIHLKVAKNRFQAIRLVVCFDPLATSTSPTVPQISDYLYKVTLDLKDTNEFVLEVPFLTRKEWATTDNSTKSEDGVLYIYNLDSLTTSGGAADSIEIVVESSAAPSFELAFPTDTSKYPANTSFNFSRNLSDGTLPGPFNEIGKKSFSERPQQGTTEAVSRGYDVIKFYDSKTPPSACPNESHISFRNLIHRYKPADTLDPTGKLASTPFNCQSLYAFWSSLFAYWRGSLRYKYVINKVGLSSNTFIGYGSGTHSTPRVYEHVDTKGSLAITVPQYSDCRLMDSDGYETKTYTYLNKFTPTLFSNDATLKYANFKFSVAAGEDFQCGTWRGVVPLYHNTTYTAPGSANGPPTLFSPISS